MLKKYFIYLFVLLFATIVFAAEITIRNLPGEATLGLIDDEDYFVVDILTPESTRKMRFDTLYAEIQANFDWTDTTDLTTGGAVVWGNIAEGELADSTVVSADIKDDTINSDDYAADSIDNEHINWADIDYLGDEGQPTAGRLQGYLLRSLGP